MPRDETAPDEFTWHRIIRHLIRAGYGDYPTAAAATLIDAAIFIYLGNDKEARLERLLNGN